MVPALRLLEQFGKMAQIGQAPLSVLQQQQPAGNAMLLPGTHQHPHDPVFLPDPLPGGKPRHESVQLGFRLVEPIEIMGSKAEHRSGQGLAEQLLIARFRHRRKKP